MANIKDFIKQLEDTSLSFEEQQQALQMIEQSLLETKLQEEKTIEDTTNAVVEAVKVVESNLNEKFNALAASPKLVGKQGERGLDGKNGKDGINGRDGRDGKDGKDGLDGENGAYVTAVEVALDDTLLITLSNGNVVKTSKEITGKKGDVGPQGPKGSKGDTGARGVPGAGVVSGGTTGQALVKLSNNDYDTAWATISSGGGSGTVTSVSGAGTVSGISLSGTVTSSGNLTLGGTLDLSSPPTIGNTAPNTGAFTTLKANSELINQTYDQGTGVLQVTGNSTHNGVVTDKSLNLQGGNNLLTYSQDYSNATWNAVTSGVTVVTDNATAPDGTTTADTATFTGAAYRYASIATGAVLNKTYTLSAWLSSTTGKDTIGLRMAGSATGADSVFSLVSLTTTPTRVQITRTFTSSDVAIIVGLDNRTVVVGGAQTTGNVVVWGFQFELGSVASAYTPTTTAAITTTNDIKVPSGQVLASDGTASLPSYSFGSKPTAGFYNYANGSIAVSSTTATHAFNYNQGGELITINTGVFSFASAGTPSSTPDVRLWRDSAGVLAQRNSTNAQAFRLYNTYTDASNYERLGVNWATNTATITTENAGTGAARNLVLNGQGGNLYLRVTGSNGVYLNSNDFLPETNLGKNLGNSSNSWNNLYAGAGNLSGNLNFTGTSNRITGDMSNATAASRVQYQTSTVNGNTIVGAIPNGTALSSSFQVANSSDPDNAAYGQITANSANIAISSFTRGTGVQLPFRFNTTGGTQFEITNTASTVNYASVTGGATTVAPTISALGSDTNIDLKLTPKGTGAVVVPLLNTTAVSDLSSMARAAGLTSITTIASTTTYTTGGITLPNQTAVANGVWRIRAFGDFTAANSATARNFRAYVTWGANTSANYAIPILINTAQTTQWQMEWTLTGTSTTALWVVSQSVNRLSIAGNAQLSTVTPASFTVPSGPQTIDLKFSNSSVIAGDSFAVHSVTIERLE